MLIRPFVVTKDKGETISVVKKVKTHTTTKIACSFLYSINKLLLKA